MLGDMLGGGKLLGKYGDDFARFAKKYGEKILSKIDDAGKFIWNVGSDLFGKFFKGPGDELAEIALRSSDEVTDLVKYSDEAAEVVVKKSDDVIYVTENGVALPTGDKYKIPDHYVENSHRPGDYGEYVDGKYEARLRIDQATPDQSGSHYHFNNGPEHYSPNRIHDGNPGFSNNPKK
jgi:hypothetical protein